MWSRHRSQYSQKVIRENQAWPSCTYWISWGLPGHCSQDIWASARGTQDQKGGTFIPGNPSTPWDSHLRLCDREEVARGKSSVWAPSGPVGSTQTRSVCTLHALQTDQGWPCTLLLTNHSPLKHLHSLGVLHSANHWPGIHLLSMLFWDFSYNSSLGLGPKALILGLRATLYP